VVAISPASTASSSIWASAWASSAIRSQWELEIGEPRRGSECSRRRCSVRHDPRLTRREWEILRLVAKGYTYREITDVLAVGSRTVRTHVQAILKKLQLRRRSELMRWYVTHKDDRGPE